MYISNGIFLKIDLILPTESYSYGLQECPLIVTNLKKIMKKVGLGCVCEHIYIYIYYVYVYITVWWMPWRMGGRHRPSGMCQHKTSIPQGRPGVIKNRQQGPQWSPPLSSGFFSGATQCVHPRDPSGRLEVFLHFSFIVRMGRGDPDGSIPQDTSIAVVLES